MLLIEFSAKECRWAMAVALKAQRSNSHDEDAAFLNITVHKNNNKVFLAEE